MDCTAKKAGRWKVTDAQIAGELVRRCGILAFAARALGISRTTIHLRINASPRLQEIRDSARETLFSLAEAKLESALDSGVVWAVLFVLNTLGRTDGLFEPDESLAGQSPSRSRTQSGDADAEIETGPIDVDVDVAHSNLLTAVRNGEPWAIKYCLRTLGGDKG